jgi:hypothetical protein
MVTATLLSQRTRQSLAARPQGLANSSDSAGTSFGVKALQIYYLAIHCLGTTQRRQACASLVLRDSSLQGTRPHQKQTQRHLLVGSEAVFEEKAEKKRLLTPQGIKILLRTGHSWTKCKFNLNRQYSIL